MILYDNDDAVVVVCFSAWREIQELLSLHILVHRPFPVDKQFVHSNPQFDNYSIYHLAGTVYDLE